MCGRVEMTVFQHPLDPTSHTAHPPQVDQISRPWWRGATNAVYMPGKSSQMSEIMGHSPGTSKIQLANVGAKFRH